MPRQHAKADPEIVEAVRKWGDNLRNMTPEQEEEFRRQHIYLNRLVINALYRIEIGQASMPKDETLYR